MRNTICAALTAITLVLCAVYAGYQKGGLSCDWAHASGSDEEPTR